jgi:hypothetical protein
MKIILLDMDGVLLTPRAYYRALQETVRLVGRALGFNNVRITDQNISAFESAGVSSEWDTAAICAALLMTKASQFDKHQQYPRSLSESPLRFNDPVSPDIQTFATKMGQTGQSELRPLKRAERLLIKQTNHHDPNQDSVLRSILHNARTADESLTHRTFQELVLGSQTYTEIYGFPALLDTFSYLLEYDSPCIDTQTGELLKEWQRIPSHQAVIFTSRPSTPLPGTFSTPEAELGAALVNLENLPILGLGGLVWLSEKFGKNTQAFLKPSPVHALAALQLALDEDLKTALLNAANLVENRSSDSSWERLNNAQVWAFEDTSGGLISALAAQSILGMHGIKLSVTPFGISDDPAKILALQRTGAEIAPEINAALQRILSTDV